MQQQLHAHSLLELPIYDDQTSTAGRERGGMDLGFPFPSPAVSPASGFPWSLGDAADHGPLLAAGFPFLLFWSFGVFFGMVRQRRHPEARIRSSHPRSSRAPSTSREHVELCVRLGSGRLSCSLVWLHV